jgi:pimeloyl-ACP methyl ester carboxylesterase
MMKRGSLALALILLEMMVPRPPNAFAAPKLKWKPCPDSRRFKCTKLLVPLNHAKPSGPTISIGITMSPATDKTKRIGSLLINPGGPGASGQKFARQITRGLSAEVLERYDIIGWDPRGVPGSGAIRCLSSLAEYDAYFQVDPSPDTPSEVAAIGSQVKLFADGCAKRNSLDTLRFAGTADVVNDMEDIRVALGEERINFFGFSYGTLLGLRYADRFPLHVGRFVLDGVLDPTADTAERAKQQAAGFDSAMNSFLDLCAPKGTVVCDWVKPGESAGAAFDRLVQRVDAKALPVKNRKGGVREVGPAEVLGGSLAALYNRDVGWPRLRQSLTALGKGDGSAFLELSDAFLDRSASGYGNVIDVNSAVNCVDVPAGKSMDWYERLAAELTKTSPRFGALAAFSNSACLYWPVPATGSTAPAVAKGAPPIVLLGTLRDPATPYVWAKNVEQTLMNAALVTYDSDGHTSYLTGNRCIRMNVDTFLVQGTVPTAGTVCKRT